MIAYSVMIVVSLLALAGIAFSIHLQNYVYLAAIIPFFITLFLIAPYKLYSNAQKKADGKIAELLSQIETQSSRIRILEERIKPQLEVEPLPKVSYCKNYPSRSWRLLIKNSGVDDAKDCRGQLVDVASADSEMDKGLRNWPKHEYLSWSNGSESVPISPSTTMELEIAIWEGYGSPLCLAYVQGEDFRKQHALKSFRTPIILIISVTSKAKPPIYCICKFHFNRLKKVGREIIEDNDNLELIKVTPEYPDIKLYQ